MDDGCRGKVVSDTPRSEISGTDGVRSWPDLEIATS